MMMMKDDEKSQSTLVFFHLYLYIYIRTYISSYRLSNCVGPHATHIHITSLSLLISIHLSIHHEQQEENIYPSIPFRSSSHPLHNLLHMRRIRKVEKEKEGPYGRGGGGGGTFGRK